MENSFLRKLAFAKSGQGGTSDYSSLSNKPQINGVTLDGNKTAAELGLGQEYTAGTNIEITEDNVINNTIPYTQNISSKVLTLGDVNTSSITPKNSIYIGNSIRQSVNTGAGSVIIGNSVDSIMNNRILIGHNCMPGSGNYGIAIGNYASASDRTCQIGSVQAKINKIMVYTSDGNKTVATTDITDNLTTRIAEIEAMLTPAEGVEF